MGWKTAGAAAPKLHSTARTRQGKGKERSAAYDARVLFRLINHKSFVTKKKATHEFDNLMNMLCSGVIHIWAEINILGLNPSETPNP